MNNYDDAKILDFLPNLDIASKRELAALTKNPKILDILADSTDDIVCRNVAKNVYTDGSTLDKMVRVDVTTGSGELTYRDYLVSRFNSHHHIKPSYQSHLALNIQES